MTQFLGQKHESYRVTSSRLAFGWVLFATLLAALAGVGDAIAQRGGRDPHLAYAFPAGCQRGKTCEIVIGGQYLKEATEVYVAGRGVEIEILDWYRPMTQGEYNNLRMKITRRGKG